MSAIFYTSLELKGTEAELLSLIKVVRKCLKNDEQDYYLEDLIGIDSFEKLSDDELLERIKESNGQIDIELSGPYGSFVDLGDVDLFEKMANVAPAACFDGVMSGFNAGGSQAFKAVLENGIMKVFNRYPKEDYDEDEETWDDEYFYIPIPDVDDSALYVAQKINNGKINVVFEKHNFAVSDSCSDPDTIIKLIESRGGKIRKSVGKTTHYVILGKNIKGYDKMAIQAITFNIQEDKNIKAITETEILALFKE